MSRKPSFDPETYDRERGTVMILHREELAPFYYLPWEYAGPIIHALFRWWYGATVEELKNELKDPRDFMLLARLVEHQKENAENFYQAKMRERENKSKAGRASAATRHERQQSATAVNSRQQMSTKDKDKEEDEVPEGIRLHSSSFQSPTGGDAAGNPPSADGGAADALPTAHVPREMRTAVIQEWPEHSADTFDERDLRERPVQFVLNMGMDEDENKARGFYTKALRELGPDVYAETCWRFIVEYVEKANAYGEPMREFNEEYTRKEKAYIAKYGNWENALKAAEGKNWHCIGAYREVYERYYYHGGRILAGMLIEAGLAHGVELAAKPTTGKGKKGGEE